jgi:hypothetical protein
MLQLASIAASVINCQERRGRIEVENEAVRMVEGVPAMGFDRINLSNGYKGSKCVYG